MKTKIIFSLLTLVTLAASLSWSLSSYKATSAPSIYNLLVSETSGGSSISSVILNDGSAKTLHIQADISDGDSCEDITMGGSAYVHMYLASENASCVDNPYNCYHSYSCNFSNCIDNTDMELSVSCTVALESNAANTVTGPNSGASWIGELVVEDSSLLSSTASFGLEVESLLAYNMDTFLDYGTLNLNATSEALPIFIQNTGNTGLDMEVHGPNPLSCSTGEIPASAVKASDASNFDYAMGLDITSLQEFELNLAPSEDVFPTETPLYFRIKMPENGAGGVCSNTLQMTAVSDIESGY